MSSDVRRAGRSASQGKAEAVPGCQGSFREVRDAWGEVTEKEIWAVAHHVLQRYGEAGGRIFITERAGELALKCDAAGINAWKLIAARFDELARGGNERH